MGENMGPEQAKDIEDQGGPALPDRVHTTGGKARTRRAPEPEARMRDAERSRERLLAAALEEFAARGFAGARVQDIATRAGVNKQLITYYFGGKEGLIHALRRRWLEMEEGFARPELPLDTLIAEYLRATLAEPQLARLLVWTGLESAANPELATGSGLGANDIAELQRRQSTGELASDLDPLLVGVAFMGAVLAPIMVPHVVRGTTGLDPQSPEFAERYAEQLRRIIRHLAGDRRPPQESDTPGPDAAIDESAGDGMPGGD